jgi:hypothetical protein
MDRKWQSETPPLVGEIYRPTFKHKLACRYRILLTPAQPRFACLPATYPTGNGKLRRDDTSSALSRFLERCYNGDKNRTFLQSGSREIGPVLSTNVHRDACGVGMKTPVSIAENLCISSIVLDVRQGSVAIRAQWRGQGTRTGSSVSPL